FPPRHEANPRRHVLCGFCDCAAMNFARTDELWQGLLRPRKELLVLTSIIVQSRPDGTRVSRRDLNTEIFMTQQVSGTPPEKFPSCSSDRPKIESTPIDATITQIAEVHDAHTGCGGHGSAIVRGYGCGNRPGRLSAGHQAAADGALRDLSRST